MSESQSNRTGKKGNEEGKEEFLTLLGRLPTAHLVMAISQWLIIASIGVWVIGGITDSVLPNNWLTGMAEFILSAGWIFLGATRISQFVFVSWTKRWYRKARSWFNRKSREKQLEGLRKELLWEFAQLEMELEDATGSMPTYEVLGEEIRRLVGEKLHGMIGYRVAVERTLQGLKDQKESNFISAEFEERINAAIGKVQERKNECAKTFDDLRAYILEQTARIVLSSRSVKRVQDEIDQRQRECGELSDRIDRLIDESPDLDLYTHDMVAS